MQVTSAAVQTRDYPELLAVARSLEASFLSEMLKAAGLADMPEAFGGGYGEEQFASFLREEQAQRFAAAGGIGLTEAIYRSLIQSGGSNGEV